jgi:hypothetical protein
MKIADESHTRLIFAMAPLNIRLRAQESCATKSANTGQLCRVKLRTSTNDSSACRGITVAILERSDILWPRLPPIVEARGGLA